MHRQRGASPLPGCRQVTPIQGLLTTLNQGLLTTLNQVAYCPKSGFLMLNRHSEAAGCVTLTGLPPGHPEAVTSAEGQGINMAFTYPSPFVQGRVLKQVLNFVSGPDVALCAMVY
jgi:hypothetical protein